MSIPEIEKLFGHSLDDDQSNRDFSLERAQHSDPGSFFFGNAVWLQTATNLLADPSTESDKSSDER